MFLSYSGHRKVIDAQHTEIYKLINIFSDGDGICLKKELEL